MTLPDKPKKLSLQAQWEEEQRLKRGENQSAPVPESPKPIDIRLPTTPTPQERADAAKKEADALRAEADLEAVRNGYSNYKDACQKLEAERKEFEAEKLKYPELLNKEKLLNEREQGIIAANQYAQKHNSEKLAEVENYYTTKKKAADLLTSKSEKEMSERKQVLEKLSAELQEKIDFYKYTVEPYSKVMAKDANLIYQYLQYYIYPILDNGAVKMFAGLGGQLQRTHQQAKVCHDILMEDAVKLLTIYNKIKGE